MKGKLLFLLILAVGLVLAIRFYLSYTSAGDLNVTPQAAEEIEKAKRR